MLATSHQYYTNRKKWHEMYDCYRFDEKCVKVFNEIVEKTNPVIILSSDWRENYTIEVMHEIFKWNGLNGKIFAYTENLWGSHFSRASELEQCRAGEINMFVKKYEPLFEDSKWIAIDDLDLSPWIVDEHFVRTPRANEGIKQSNIKEKILKKLL